VKVLSIPIPIANERKAAMKKLMVVLGCAAMVALSGCYAAKKHAESIGIIGGEDGQTAIWMTTRLPWSKDCPQEK
jgi:Na+-transporting methylmalonyl-CoA/oxaloacetate decarboxylase beta subunit